VTQPNEIVDKLRTLRVSGKFSQEDISEYAGCSRAHMMRVEALRKYPRLDMVCTWAEAVGYELVLMPKEQRE
jgi:transcriptional regulator with XRE-family HTH domain